MKDAEPSWLTDARGTCDCSLCALNRALWKDPIDRDEVAAGIDALLDGAVETDMRLAHLIEATRKFCGRLDAPSYLREALDLASGGAAPPQHTPPEGQ